MLTFSEDLNKGILAARRLRFRFRFDSNLEAAVPQFREF